MAITKKIKMETQRRFALKKLFASAFGLTGLGFAANAKTILQAKK